MSRVIVTEWPGLIKPLKDAGYTVVFKPSDSTTKVCPACGDDLPAVACKMCKGTGRVTL